MGEGWGEGDSDRTKAVSSLNDLFAGPGVPNRRCRLHYKPRARDPNPGHRHTSPTDPHRSSNRHRGPFLHAHAGSISYRNCSPHPDRIRRRRFAR